MFDITIKNGYIQYTTTKYISRSPTLQIRKLDGVVQSITEPPPTSFITL